jgi:hypothetical protein
MKDYNRRLDGFPKRPIKIFLILMPLLLLQPVYGAQDHNITVMGGWTNPIDSTDLISGAGSHLTNSYQSGINATILTITGNNKKNAVWQVYVSRSDMNWPSNFVLCVKRTGAGDGKEGTTINGGLSFIEVGAAKTLFFSGTGNHHNIPIQYQLSGVSLQTGPNNYNTGVVFTVTP